MNARRFKAGLLSLLLCVGCTKGKDEKLQLNIHFPKGDLVLDPHKMDDFYSMMIVTQLFRGLLRFDSAGGVVPDLAVSWKESKDHTTYDFKLGNNTFSNGEKITAKNVQMSFARIFVLKAGMAADLDYIAGSQKFIKSNNLSDLGIKVVSDDTIQFHLENPSALFLKQIAVTDCAIMPFTEIKSLDQSPLAYSGPYKLSRQSDDDLTVTKWRKDRLESTQPPQTIRFFGTKESGVSLAHDKLTDSLDGEPVSDSDLKSLKEKGWNPSPTELTSETFIILNPQVIPLELRKYLYSQVDSKNLEELVADPRLKAAYGLIPVNFPGELSMPETESIKSSHPVYNGPSVTFNLDYNGDSSFEKTVVSYLKTVWASDKFKVQYNGLDGNIKLQKMFKKQSDAVIGRKLADYPDGFSVLTYFKGKYSSNYFFVDDPNIDTAINQSVKEFDLDKRAQVYKKIEKMILEKFNFIPLVFGSRSSGLWSHNVKSVPSHPMGVHTMALETIEMRPQ